MLYKPLSRDQVGGIVDLMLADLAKRMEQKQLALVVTDQAKQLIADSGYDPVYGARPLKRFIQSHLETALARAILSEDPAPESTLKVDVENGQFTVKVLSPEASA